MEAEDQAVEVEDAVAVVEGGAGPVGTGDEAEAVEEGDTGVQRATWTEHFDHRMTASIRVAYKFTIIAPIGRQMATLGSHAYDNNVLLAT